MFVESIHKRNNWMEIHWNHISMVNRSEMQKKVVALKLLIRYQWNIFIVCVVDFKPVNSNNTNSRDKNEVKPFELWLVDVEEKKLQ